MTDYLESLGRAGDIGPEAYTPTVRRLLGIVPFTVTLGDYCRHLREKNDRKGE